MGWGGDPQLPFGYACPCHSHDQPNVTFHQQSALCSVLSLCSVQQTVNQFNQRATLRTFDWTEDDVEDSDASELCTEQITINNITDTFITHVQP